MLLIPPQVPSEPVQEPDRVSLLTQKKPFNKVADSPGEAQKNKKSHENQAGMLMLLHFGKRCGGVCCPHVADKSVIARLSKGRI